MELNLQPPKRKISYRTANAAATVLEFIYTLIPTHPEPPLTRIHGQHDGAQHHAGYFRRKKGTWLSARFRWMKAWRNL